MSMRNIIYIHGGAFKKPAGPADARFCGEIRDASLTVTPLQYSLNTPLPVPLDELLAEIERRGPCVLIGTSAGAVLASMARHPNIRGVVMVSGCATYDWAMSLTGRDEKLATKFFGVKGKFDTDDGRTALIRYLPEFNIFTAPPTLIIHGDRDPRFPIKYVRPFAEKVGAELIVNEGMDHGIENGTAQLVAIKAFVGAHLP